MDKVAIRPLRTLAEFEGCVDIQRQVWKHSDIDITPVHHFCIAVHTGSILLGAFSGGKLAGYAYSFPAMFGPKLSQHSHHLAVRPEYQGVGLGKMLKWAQREEALARGYNLITWTYDPMLARNANLNLHLLGGIVRTYLDDFYGPTPALVLDEGVPTDRLLVEWLIASKLVSDRETAGLEAIDPAAFPKVVERRPEEVGPDSGPRRPVFGRKEESILVEIPPHIRELKGRAGLIAAWQKNVRAALVHYFKAGYELDDFIFADRCFYVLKKS